MAMSPESIPSARVAMQVDPKVIVALDFADPMQAADAKTVLTTKEKLIGIGLAQGDHPSLGKNTVYVAVVFGTKK